MKEVKKMNIYTIGHYYLLISGFLFNLWLIWRFFWKDTKIKETPQKQNH